MRQIADSTQQSNRTKESPKGVQYIEPLIVATGNGSERTKDLSFGVQKNLTITADANGAHC